MHFDVEKALKSLMHLVDKTRNFTVSQETRDKYTIGAHKYQQYLDYLQAYLRNGNMTDKKDAVRALEYCKEYGIELRDLYAPVTNMDCMTQEKADEYFDSELGQQINVFYSTCDNGVFIREEEAIKHTKGELIEGSKPLDYRTILEWYPSV